MIDGVISGLNRIEIDFDPSGAISAHSVVATDVLCAVHSAPDSAIRAALVQEPCEGSPVWS